MTSSRPYLVRALYEWINDNYLTPYILVNTDLPEVYVPKEYINDNQIVLNVAPDAIHQLSITNTELEFHASFSGVSRHIYAPMDAIAAIYAKENGAGMFFGEEPGGDTPPDNSKYEAPKDKSGKKPFLKIVK
ncbi:MAG: ClpXP protease specificity-enhancing factor [Gammaproteobacteria bacterium]|nr:ClpXP protease specificity-enhancing factor [Gammaproteobacteria bacterium]